jgi:hypothetical protein
MYQVSFRQILASLREAIVRMCTSMADEARPADASSQHDLVVGQPNPRLVEYFLILPLGLLLYVLLGALCSLPEVVRAIRNRVAAWELLEAPVRTVDLCPLGFQRRFTLRQEYGSDETAGAEAGVDHSIRRTGLTLWGGALDLCSFLLKDGSAAGHLAARAGQGCSVLELGAGLGLPSMVAALAGASPVVVTDGSAVGLYLI